MSNRIKSDTIQIGNNYVLPIEQSNVTAQQAKVKRIIEETGVKAQSIINGAETKSQAIMQNATNEAEKMIDAAKAQAQEEYNKIVEQAYQEGFAKGENDGLEKFKQDASDALKSLDVLATSSFDVKKNIIDSATLDIVDLVSAIADKVCHIKFDEEVLKRITIDSIKQLREKENITTNGVKNYLHQFIEPFFPFIIPNIFGKIGPLISMSLRLFGNILKYCHQDMRLIHLPLL